MFPHLYTWVRAKFLYAIMPADASKWKVLRDPVAVFFYVMTVFPLYAINIWSFVLLFLFIDKRDEWQLVGFILKFKMTQAIGQGVFLMAKFAVFACLPIGGSTPGRADHALLCHSRIPAPRRRDRRVPLRDLAGTPLVQSTRRPRPPPPPPARPRPRPRPPAPARLWPRSPAARAAGAAGQRRGRRCLVRGPRAGQFQPAKWQPAVGGLR